MRKANEQMRAAAETARAQRLALRQRTSETIHRLRPQRIVEDMLIDVRREARELFDETATNVRAHPITTLAAVGGLVALTFHRQIGHALSGSLMTDAPDKDSHAFGSGNPEPADDDA